LNVEISGVDRFMLTASGLRGGVHVAASFVWSIRFEFVSDGRMCSLFQASLRDTLDEIALQPGIRAQLIDTRTADLLSDFVIEPGPKSTHVLNAVSPAFTSSLPFAEHVVGLMKLG